MKLGTKQLHEPTCSVCGSDISDVADTCLTCFTPLVVPNVRAAERTEEKNALTGRYIKALEDAASSGITDKLEDFTEKIKASCAVINVDIDFLYGFLKHKKSLYTTYSLGIRGQLRSPAEGENDQHRLAVEALLFGSYGENIRYAALSLDGVGVQSYGEFSIKLKEVAINKRSSLLEDNSYVFIEKHEIRPGKSIPIGYRSAWGNRDKLALAKLAQRISSTTTEADYHRILLFSEGIYATDDFIEVHIYGPFDALAIESVTGSSFVEGKVENAMVEVVKEYLENSGKTWVEQ